MNASNRRLAVAVTLFCFGLILAVLVTAWMSDGPRFMAVVGSLAVGPIFGALLCMMVSYVSIGLSFAALLQATPYRVTFPKLMSITLISCTFNYVVSTAGVSSMAVRVFLFKQEKVPMSLMVPLNIAQSMMTNLVLSLACCGGLIYLRNQPGFEGGWAQVLIWCALGALVLLVSVMALAFLHDRIRHKAVHFGLGAVAWVREKIFRKSGFPNKLHEIAHHLEDSTRLLHRGRVPMGLALFWVWMDWTFSAFTLHQCFAAVGVVLTPGVLLVGFTLAFLSSTVNVTPGGLGIMEGLLAMTYGHLGISTEKALVAALLFRLIYFLLPLAVSAALYLDTLLKLLRNSPQKAV